MIELLAKGEREKLDSIFASEFDSAVPDERYAHILADIEDGELRGFIVAESVVLVMQVYVAPNHQGTGTAQRLIRAVERSLANAQRSVITVASEPRFERLFQLKDMRRIGGATYRKGMY